MNTSKIISQIDKHILNKELSDASNLCDLIDTKKTTSEEILLRRGIIASEKNQFDLAITYLTSALKLNNSSVVILQNLARAHERHGDVNDALLYLKRIYALQPKSYQALKNLAFFLYDFGITHEARELLEKLIIEFPFDAPTHFAYSRTGHYKRNNITLKYLQNSLSTLSSLTIGNQIKLGFAAAKANQDIGEYKSAFSVFKGVNQLHFNSQPYTLNHDKNLLKDVQQQFGAQSPWPLEDWQQKAQHNYPCPIFILGMPRSGSTLLEQMIGANSQAKAAGELDFLNSAIKTHLIKDYKTFANAAQHLSNSDFNNAANEYLEKTKQLANGCRYVVDKMPGNFAFIGIIKLLFPNAKIVLTERHPMDVIWSNFSTLFNDNLLLYTYDLETLTNYYVAYHKSTRYWLDTYPSGCIKTHSHEALLDNPEVQLKNILNYLELPWEEGCLNFRKSNTQIKTASHLQVKEPINKSGLGRWNNYSNELAEVQSKLVNAGVLK